MASLLDKFLSLSIILWICLNAILTPAHCGDAVGQNLNALKRLSNEQFIPFDGVPDRANVHAFFRELMRIGQGTFIPKTHVYRNNPVTFYTNYIYSIAKATWTLNEHEFSGIMTDVYTSENRRQIGALAETLQNIYGVISDIKNPQSRKRLTTYEEFKQKIEDIIAREIGTRPATTSRHKEPITTRPSETENSNRAIQKTNNGTGQYAVTGNNITFGGVKPHPFISKSVVFVSTYDLSPPPFHMGIAIRLTKKGDRDRYIVIQNPYFDPGNKSPYTIRTHAIFHDTTPGGDPGLTSRTDIELDEALNSIGTGTEKRVELTNVGDGNIQSHAGTLSPNNMHLTELPVRTLKNDEIYSFVSKITGRDDKRHIKADTLHILAGSTIREKIHEIAQDSRTVGDFIDSLVTATLNNFPKGLIPHINKIRRFIAE